ncbi:endoglucanase [Nonomuraea solani]|uniref:Glucanase n=1 Tax=Nonomuraea solani TaxID=1144553 RepID=A0A1H6B414_9ACTN|nr:glycoside hydrolase family 6 protein [Nonomuraea solani]SEG55342.1 endoglucanase [Nonomuraea solani]
MRLLVSRAAALSAALAAVLLVPQPASAAAQLIGNGTFTTSTAPWAAIGQSAVTVETGKMRVEVKSVVSNPWDAMVAAPTTAALSPGQSYTLSFDAYSTVAYTARTTVQYTATPSSNQSLAADVRLTTASKRYSIPFVAAAGTATAAEVTFQLGGSTGKPVVRFDNVSLMQTQTTRPTALYVNTKSNPAAWVTANPNHASKTAIQTSIASKPIFEWFGGWFPDITQAVDTYVGAAQAQDKLPMLAAYNIPHRDACATESAGGAGTAEAYAAWITEFAKAIGNRHAIVVLEPDAVAAAGCLDRDSDADTNSAAQYAILANATQVLRTEAPNAWVYLDAGNATWHTPAQIVPLLQQSGISNTRGFSVNVSNYLTTGVTEPWAAQVGGALAKPYVIDTSRNGNGPWSDSTPEDNWCNPPGRALGTPPVKQTSGAEYLFWVKVPGDSDGQCGIAPPNTPAGKFSPELAMSLINS